MLVRTGSSNIDRVVNLLKKKLNHARNSKFNLALIAKFSHQIGAPITQSIITSLKLWERFTLYFFRKDFLLHQNFLPLLQHYHSQKLLFRQLKKSIKKHHKKSKYFKLQKSLSKKINNTKKTFHKSTSKLHRNSHRALLRYLKTIRRFTPQSRHHLLLVSFAISSFSYRFKTQLQTSTKTLFASILAHTHTIILKLLHHLRSQTTALTPFISKLFKSTSTIRFSIEQLKLNLLFKLKLARIKLSSHYHLLTTNLFFLPAKSESPDSRKHLPLSKPFRFPSKQLFWAGTSLTLILTALTSIYLFYTQILQDLPNPTNLALSQPELNTKIYDRNGTLLYKLYKNENRSLITLDQVPSYLQQATIAIEDQDFYQHSGVSLSGIVRALKVNLSNQGFQGGSTITQQLVKNTLLTNERTLSRKLKEAVVAIMTEFLFSKDQILTMYFNQVPYGGTTYGIEEAARTYFDKSTPDLTLAEASFLAGLPASPTTYSPYGSNPELAKARQLQVLTRMVEDGYISEQQAQQTYAQPLNIIPSKNPIFAPHFVMYVRDYLVSKYGLARVEQGGLEVITTLDLDLHHRVEKLVNQEVQSLKNLRVSNGASLVTHPSTGEILAMVGSINYFDQQNDGQVNLTIRPRQPGSSIKPLTYSLALSQGFTPATLIQDSPVCFESRGQPPYCPKNYDGKFHGNVTIRKALANSYNIPAVKVLNQLGVSNFIDHASALGITTWTDTNRFGLALTLGGGEVTMIDMATAYGVFANSGNRTDLSPIIQVRDVTGKILESHCTDPTLSQSPLITKTIPCTSHRVLDPRIAYQITDILSDNQARASAFGTNSVLNIPNQQVAVKTGTTNSLRDNWTIGYTQKYLVVTWVGNNDNTPMSYIASGITGASPMWNKIISLTLSPDQPNTFPIPENLAKVSICSLTGSLSCQGCPSKDEYFLPGTEPTRHCSQDQVANLNEPPVLSN